jgi:hypothetical protein
MSIWIWAGKNAHDHIFNVFRDTWNDDELDDEMYDKEKSTSFFLSKPSHDAMKKTKTLTHKD